MINLEVKKIKPDAIVPTYAHEQDAGADLYSYEEVDIYPGERHAVRTGIAVNIPKGFVGLVHPRSGLAANKGITVLNAPGTIDSGYQGELKVILINLDPYVPVTIKKGERIAQLVLQKYETMYFEIVDELPGITARQGNGFGSTGE